MFKYLSIDTMRTIKTQRSVVAIGCSFRGINIRTKFGCNVKVKAYMNLSSNIPMLCRISAYHISLSHRLVMVRKLLHAISTSEG